MSKLTRLMGIQVRQRYNPGLFAYQWRTERKKFLLSALVVLIVLVTFGAMYGFYAYGSGYLIRLVRPLRMSLAQDILSLILVLLTILTLFSGTRSVLSRLFMARDTEFLALLPVREGTVFLSKFLLLMAGQCGFALLVVLPPALTYLSGAFTLGAVARTLLVALLLPGIPLVVSGLLSLLLMRFSAWNRFRDLFAVIGSLLMVLLIVVAQQVLIAQFPQELDAGFLIRYLLGRQSLMTGLTAWFPPARWATLAITGTGSEAWLNMLWFAGVSLLCLGLLYAVSARTYYRGALAHSQGTKRKHGRAGEALSYPAHRPVVAVALKEWRMMVRTPVYLLNSMAGLIVIPLLLMLPLMHPEMRQDFSGLLSLLLSQVDERLLLLILSAVFCFVGSMNPAAGTVFSREGRSFWLCKVLPTPPRTQLLGKLLFGGGLTVIFHAVLLACLLPFLGQKIGLLCAACLLSLLLSWTAMVLAVYIDLRSPRLAWNNPTEAIKQNLHAMLGMIFTFVLMAALGLAMYGLTTLGLGLLPLLLAAVVLLLLLSLIVTRWALGRAAWAYERLEV